MSCTPSNKCGQCDYCAGPPGVPVADPAIFHGVAGEIVRTADPSTEADPVGVYVSLLAGVGVLVGPSPHYRVGNTRHPLLIWPLLFGRTGSGRKGECEQTSRLFLRAADDMYTALRAGGLSSGEGLIERVRDAEPDNDKDTGGTDDKRLLVFEPEFASVMARAKGDVSTLGPVLRDAWEGGALTRMNRRAYGASWSHIGVVGHVTPKEFKARLAEGDMSGGTFNRFMPVYVERSKKLPLPEGVDPQTVGVLAGRLREGIAAARKLTRLQLDAEASELWSTEVYDDLTEADDDDQPWTEFARRAAPYCLRVAALHSALDGRALIGKPDLAAAAALVRYSVASAKYILGPRRDPRFDRIVRAIDGAGMRGMTRTQLSALFSRNLPKATLSELLAELIADGKYEMERIPSAGRPVECYRPTKKTK